MAQDYIMRLLQQIGVMLAAIISRRRNGQVLEAKQEIENACLQTVGLPLNTVKRMTPDALTQHLLTFGGNRHPRAVMLAELLIQDAEMYEERNENLQALGCYLHAFCLLFDAIEILSHEEQAVYRPKLATLAAKLDHLPPNPYVTEKLSAYRASQIS